MESKIFHHAKVAACNLNQWALDFEGNKRRIIESIRQAKEQKCTYRLGPELEITGYSCEDHFLELDTCKHSWEVLAEILNSDLTDGMICDIGMPVIHRSVLFNVRVIILNRYIHLIRPKTGLADDGNYREGRYFTAWRKKDLEDYTLPLSIRSITGQETAKFGVAILSLQDTEIGIEICEELWQPNSPHISMQLDGAEIIFNSSASHFALGRVEKRFDLLLETTGKEGGCYVYANLVGCDGERLYFDGCSMISANGTFLAVGKQFTLSEVEVVTAVVDLDAIREKRVLVKSRAVEAVSLPSFPRVNIDFKLCQSNEYATKPISREGLVLSKAAEVGYGPGCYLWDYMRKGGAAGYFLAFSGGADSTATALIVYNMAYLLHENVTKKLHGHEFVLSELRKVFKDPKFYPKSPQDITKRVLFTCYMQSKHSSEDTRRRARQIAEEIGSTHQEVSIDEICDGFMKGTQSVIKEKPKFVSEGGTMGEDLALQNLQARSRMVLCYYLAQLLPIQHKLPSYLFVIGSANLDECLRGYVTKYDCSSADINPIGGFSKLDLRKFLYWSHDARGIKSVLEIIEAPPTAELRPMGEGGMQKDEEEMGMTYEELSIFGKFRKINMFGPVAMFKKLVQVWNHVTVDEIATKVKRFFRFYSINRHKMTVMTPAIHGERYGCEDNRFDLRPFLYNSNWNYQFERIDEIAKFVKEENPDLKHTKSEDVKECQQNK